MVLNYPGAYRKVSVELKVYRMRLLQFFFFFCSFCYFMLKSAMIVLPPDSSPCSECTSKEQSRR